MLIDPVDAVCSLNSTLCPICGRQKARAKTLCLGCYRMMPQNLRDDLYKRVGDGYEQALAAAFEYHGSTRMILPTPDQGELFSRAEATKPKANFFRK